MKCDYKVGDLVTWLPDGDMGVITRINMDAMEDHKRGLPADPFWVVWFNDPGANGWHDHSSVMKLVSSS